MAVVCDRNCGVNHTKVGKEIIWHVLRRQIPPEIRGTAKKSMGKCNQFQRQFVLSMTLAKRISQSASQMSPRLGLIFLEIYLNCT